MANNSPCSASSLAQQQALPSSRPCPAGLAQQQSRQQAATSKQQAKPAAATPAAAAGRCRGGSFFGGKTTSAAKRLEQQAAAAKSHSSKQPALPGQVSFTNLQKMVGGGQGLSYVQAQYSVFCTILPPDVRWSPSYGDHRTSGGSIVHFFLYCPPTYDGPHRTSGGSIVHFFLYCPPAYDGLSRGR